ncbi:MAG: FliH/SctL family protein [Magnetospirillum sp.]|nr:FliH/SctL family protein [Magnetospirillum sp.]
MASYRKYMFDLDFDRPHAPQPVVEPEVEEAEAVVEEEEAPPPPTFTEEEVAFARETAFEEGRQIGHMESQEQSERMTATALTALSDQMETVFRQQAEANEASSRAAVRVALAVLKKVLPAACETHAFEEVTRVVEEVVGHILDEPRIIVKVAEPLVEAVRERLEAVAQANGFEGRVVVQADARLKPGDCRVEWTDGGAERDQARLLEEIETTVERALAPPERRTPAGAEANADFAGT